MPHLRFPAALAWSATYIALFILLQLVLTFLVVHHRRSRRIAYGDGGDREMLVAMRAQANFVENVPFAMAALIVLPMLGAADLLVHAVGLPMLIGRILHAQGLYSGKVPSFGRVSGMLLTWASLVIAVVAILMQVWL